MTKKVIAAALSFAFALGLTAQEGIQISSSSIEFTKVTPENIKAAQGASDAVKTSGKVTIRNKVDQAGFDAICKGLPWIKDLSVIYNPNLDNIKAVAKLSQLEKLNMKGWKKSYTTAVDVSPLKKLVNLKRLDFTTTYISNEKTLKNLENLTWLSIYGAAVSDLSFLEGKANLKHLSMAGSKHTFKDYKALESLTALEYLDISRNKAANEANLKSIGKITSLLEFRFKKLEVSNLNFLAGCKSLEEIDGSKCPLLTDVSVVAQLPKLKKFDVYKTGINSLKGFEKCASLENLDVSKSKVSDLSPLSSLKKLEGVDVGDTEVTDITPLMGVKTLEFLEVSPKVPAAQIEKIKASHSDIDVRIKY